MRLPEFDYFEPGSVAEACALLAEEPRRSAVFAGGTDVLVDLKAGTARYKRLVSLRRIESLRRIGFSTQSFYLPEFAKKQKESASALSEP